MNTNLNISPSDAALNIKPVTIIPLTRKNNHTRAKHASEVKSDDKKVSIEKSISPQAECEAAGGKALTISEIYTNILRDFPDVLSVEQVSTALGISTKTLYRILNEGSLKSLKIGRAFKIPKLYVMQYIKVLDCMDQQ